MYNVISNTIEGINSHPIRIIEMFVTSGSVVKMRYSLIIVGKNEYAIIKKITTASTF
ncbi:hypothetical protein LCGC14_2648970 [marine sediment metagenome]|uniref:Uncharacterized protein n=1 Tax=marine sediment metagenome TaxID=412755 RepID=A0A0F8ZVC4_9ZZZZ